MIIIELIATNLAYMVVLAVPMSVLVACLMAFGKFSELNEFTAIRAAGINPLSIVRPIFIASCMLAAFLMYFSNDILPEANYKARSLFLDIRMQRPGFDLQENIFYDGIDGYNFLVRKIPPASDSLFNVTLFREGTDDIEAAVIKADRGILKSVEQTDFLSLILLDGSINRNLSNSPDGKTRIERTFFNSYRINFDMSDLSFSRTDPNRRRRDDRTMSSQMMIAIIDSLHRDTVTDFDRLTAGQGVRQLRQLFDEEEVRLRQLRERVSRAVENESAHLAYTPSDSEYGANTITSNIVYASTFTADESTELFYQTEATLSDAGSDNEVGPYNSRLKVLNKLDSIERQIDVTNRSIITLRNSSSQLSSLQNNINWRAERIAQYMVEIHKKISIPVGCIIFVLVGAPLGILTRKGNLGFNALISSILFTYYWITVIQGEKLADRMIISPFWGMWFGNVTLLILGIYLMAKVMFEFKFSDLWTRTSGDTETQSRSEVSSNGHGATQLPKKADSGSNKREAASGINKDAETDSLR